MMMMMIYIYISQGQFNMAVTAFSIILRKLNLKVYFSGIFEYCSFRWTSVTVIVETIHTMLTVLAACHYCYHVPRNSWKCADTTLLH